MKRFLFVFIVFFGVNSVYGKLNTELNFEFLCDSALFYNSQEIRYSLNGFDSIQLKNSVVLVQILDKNSESIIYNLHEFAGKSIQGNFLIPNNIVSGNYLLIARLINREGNVIKSTQRFIPIINFKTFTSDDMDTSNRSTLPIPSLENTLKSTQLTGRVLNATENGAENIIVVLQSHGDSDILEFATTNKEGFFSFTEKIRGLNNLRVSILNPDQNYSIIINNFPYLNKKNVDYFPFFALNSKQIDNKELLLNFFIEQQLDTSVRNIPTLPKYTNVKYERIIDITEYIELNSVFDIIKEVIPLVKIKMKNDEVTLKLLNTYNNQYHKKGPLILCDGFLISDIKKILNKDPNEILLVKIAYHPGLNTPTLGTHSRFGIISFTTKSEDIPTGINSLFFKEVQGYFDDKN
ncbi:MAG: hypothetical protein OEY34_00895 [Cyclobacteriaceae bacterium]|nr:hypothetical protein [Cyclobacteriaceae bacterium]